MCPSSELSYGLEPHSLIYSCGQGQQRSRLGDVGAGVYPGWRAWVGTWEGCYTGYQSEGQIEAYFMEYSLILSQTAV